MPGGGMVGVHVYWRLAFIFLLTACDWSGSPVNLHGVDTRLTILHTGDIHSRLFPYELDPNAADQSLGMNAANAPFGGAARLGALIRRQRARADRVLHLDSGDCFQGAPVFNLKSGEAELRFLSEIGLDAMTIGNHEFDSGVNNLVQQLGKWASFDVLAANFVQPDPTVVGNHQLGQIARAYAIYNLRGLKVAVIGMANISSLTSIGEGGNSLGITPLEQNEVVRTLVNYLHPMVDLVIVLTHLGLVEDAELVRGYETVVWKDRRPKNWTETIEDLGDGRIEVKVPGIENIDLIVGGHLHTVTNPPQLIVSPSGRETILMHSGAFAKYLGRIDLALRDDVERGGKRIVSHKYQVFPVDERLAAYADSRVLEMMEPYAIEMHQKLDLRRVIGFAPASVLRRSAKGNGDSALGNMVTEAMRARRRVETQFALTNSLGIRDNIYAGPVTLEDMYNVFPFENTVTVIYLSGLEVQDMLDFVASKSATRGCASQAEVAGIRWTLDCGQVVLNRANNADAFVSPAKEITILGVPLQENESYKVAVNDYIAAGGSGFRMLKRNTTKLNTGLSLRDALIDYMGTLPLCGDYEQKNNICGADDTTSVKLCKEIGRRGRIPGDPHRTGPYAETPCILALEDGRTKLKTQSGPSISDDDDHDGDDL